jgi:CBS domain-containing protein/nucleotide-binding universal stress UspA family protein
MYQNILVGLDGSAAGRQALEVALELAKVGGGKVSVISVVEKLPAYAATVGEVEETRQQSEKYFHRLQEAALVRAKQVGVPLHGVILAGNAAQVISRYADREGFDLIVLGAAGHGSLTGHIGSTADHISELATCSVLVVRKGTSHVRVRDAMSRQVKTVQRDTPLSQVVTLLWREGVKAVPVTENEHRVSGIITGGDLLNRGGMDLRLSLQKTLNPEELKAQLDQLERSGKTAQDVMTTPVVTIQENASLADATSVMATKHIKRLPVVNEAGLLVGILSRIDVLRQIAALGGLGEPEPEVPTGPARIVRDIMIKDVPTVREDASLEEVMTALAASPFRRVVVLDEVGRVAGLISDRELLDRVDAQTRPSTLQSLIQRFRFGTGETKKEPHLREGRATDIMISPVAVVTDESSVLEAIRLMVQRGVKRLPVVDAVGQLVGMVDRQSLLRAVAISEPK